MAFVLPTPEQQAAKQEQEIVGVLMKFPDGQSFTLNCKTLSQTELEALDRTKTQLLADVIDSVEGVVDASGNLVTDVAPVLQFLASDIGCTDKAVECYFSALRKTSVKSEPAGNRRPVGASRTRS